MGVAVVVVALAGCGGKPSAVSAGSSGAAPQVATADGAAQGGAPAAGRDPRDLPIPQVNGKPMWAPNRKHTAEENAAYQFSKNGGDFGAKSETEYVTKVHAFIENPPSDVESIDRANGDRLMYDPAKNVFAVVSKTGAPRTMFKPRDGAAYWAQQKDRESKRSSSSADRGGGGSDQS